MAGISKMTLFYVFWSSNCSMKSLRNRHIEQMFVHQQKVTKRIIPYKDIPGICEGTFFTFHTIINSSSPVKTQEELPQHLRMCYNSLTHSLLVILCTSIKLILQILMKSQHCCKAGKYLYTDEYSSWLPVCHAKFSDVLASLQTQTITMLVASHSWALNTYTGFISKQFQPQPPFFAQSLNEPWAKHTVWGNSVSSNNLRISVNQHHLQ